MIGKYSLFIIPPVLSLATAYALAVVSLTWGKLNREKALLALICVWWSMLSWAFITHNVVSDPAVIMKVERFIHTFFVFSPAMSLLFFQVITGHKNRFMLGAFFVTSTVFSLFVHTKYYFYDFNYYSWGMIARGGMAMTLFSVYGAVSTLYIFILFVRRLQKEKNSVLKLKINYLFISFFLSVILTLTNIPAMNGIDFYPLGNLNFVPLGIMTYGILRYRLLEIGSIVHYTLFWIVLSSLIVVPNLFVLKFITGIFSRVHLSTLSLIFITWFMLNYFYFNRIQPVINRLVNRKSYNLKKMEKNFIRDLALLKNLDDLKRDVIHTLEKTLDINRAELYLRTIHTGTFADSGGNIVNLNGIVASGLRDCRDVIIQKSILESKLEHDDGCRMMLEFLSSRDREYCVPLKSQNELIALILMSEKKDRRQFGNEEYRFIARIAAYASIALANSVMYQNLSDVNDNLERIVEERTSLIEKQKFELENDIQFARKIQMSLLPKNIPMIKKISIAYRYEPVMGVGGDFIDIHYREGMDDVGLFICDVSGHGASSAMIASMVKMSLNSWGRFIQKPAGAFIEMKKLLRGKIGDNFISAYMCCIDLKDGTVTSASAGHLPMIIMRAGGLIETVKPQGKLILDMECMPYQEVVSRLYPGDTIVLYTDGVIEARMPGGEMIGMENFTGMLREGMGLGPEDLCAKIYGNIFNGVSQTMIEDDFALLVAQYTG